jgi:hypothetical protein
MAARCLPGVGRWRKWASDRATACVGWREGGGGRLASVPVRTACISAQRSGEEALEPGRSGRRPSSAETATSFGIQRDRGEPGRRRWRPDGPRLGSSIARLGVALGTCATEGVRRRRGR